MIQSRIYWSARETEIYRHNSLCSYWIVKLKFIYFEKATKCCEVFPLLLTAVHKVKSKGRISQNFVAFSEYINFNVKTKMIILEGIY